MLLVIGITGHTGRYFLEELIKNKYKDKIRFMLRKKSNKSIFDNCPLDYEIVEGDLNNDKDIYNACENVDTILEIYNINYSLKILENAISRNVKRIIFVHTTGIFSKYKMASKNYKIIEEEVLKKSLNKIDITILRPTMIYGDICDHNISKFIKMIDKMRIYPLIAGGKAKLQPVNARDLGRAYYEVLMNKEKTSNKQYNLSGSTEISIRDMLKLISRKIGKKTLFIYVPMWISLLAAYLLRILTFNRINIIEKVLRMDETRTFKYENATNDFGYNPMSFEKGLDIEIKQYLENVK